MTEEAMAPVVQLTNLEAVPLASAFVAHRARESGIRALIIKGVVLEEQGLRTARAYADVDVIVDPDRVPDLVAALGTAGWRPRTHLWVFDRLDVHSITLINESWPCDIDVHSHFPGFLAPSRTVFDELWRRRVSLRVASRPVWATDEVASAAVLALHSLRKPGIARNSAEFAHLVGHLSGRDEFTADLANFAARTGSTDTLRPLLDRIGAPRVAGPRVPRGALRAWRRRTVVRSRAGQWITYMSTVGWTRWPREVLLVAWPPRDLYLQEHPGIRDHPRVLFVERSKRIARGIRDLARVSLARRP